MGAIQLGLGGFSFTSFIFSGVLNTLKLLTRIMSRRLTSFIEANLGNASALAF